MERFSASLRFSSKFLPELPKVILYQNYLGCFIKMEILAPEICCIHQDLYLQLIEKQLQQKKKKEKKVTVFA